MTKIAVYSEWTIRNYEWDT